MPGMEKRQLLIGLVAAAALFGLFKCITRPTDEKAAIRAVVRGSIEAIEQQSTKKFMGFIAPDFTSNIAGAHNSKGLKNLIRSLVFNPKTRVSTRISEEYVEYDAQSDAGRVELALSAWRRKKNSKMGQVIPGNARRFRFLIDLKKVDERWRIHRVTRRPNK